MGMHKSHQEENSVLSESIKCKAITKLFCSAIGFHYFWGGN